MSKSKGRRTLNKAKEYLEEQGYVLDECEQGGRFRRHKDLFAGYCMSCWKRIEDKCCENEDRFDGFDLIGIKGKHTLYVQVKTNVPAKQHGFKQFAKKFASRNIKVWVMTWYDRNNWRIQKYYSNGQIKEIDFRKGIR